MLLPESTRRARHALACTLALLPLAVAACSAGTPCSFVEGARQFTDTVLPDYVRYLEADPGLDPVQREMRLLVLAKWRATLEDAESLCAERQPAQ